MLKAANGWPSRASDAFIATNKGSREKASREPLERRESSIGHSFHASFPPLAPLASGGRMKALGEGERARDVSFFTPPILVIELRHLERSLWHLMLSSPGNG